MNQYQKFNTFGKLRNVMLGSFFYPEYFSKISNSKVRDPLMKMAAEINEDLDQFQLLLENFGVVVIRAPQPTGYFDRLNPHKPPLQVRNTHAVVGNYMYQFSPDWYHAIDPILREYCPNVINLEKENTDFYTESMQIAKENYNLKKDLWYSHGKYIELAGSDWPSYEDIVAGVQSPIVNIDREIQSFKSVLEYETKELAPLQGPNVINTDDMLYVDTNEYCNYAKWLGDQIQDQRPIRQFTSKAGHVDGCFAILNSNTILGIDPLIDYADLFPNHKLISLSPESAIPTMKEFKLMSGKVNGSWWLAGEEHNDELIEFVEKYLNSWAGYISESVFEVNVLSLNEHAVFVTDISPDLEKQLNLAGIECILVSWRHRFFVDGGLHCITLDLYRD